MAKTKIFTTLYLIEYQQKSLSNNWKAFHISWMILSEGIVHSCHQSYSLGRITKPLLILPVQEVVDTPKQFKIAGHIVGCTKIQSDWRVDWEFWDGWTDHIRIDIGDHCFPLASNLQISKTCQPVNDPESCRDSHIEIGFLGCKRQWFKIIIVIISF